jgi:RimJ/RimL family protein N-acetyltransferase
MVHNDVLAGDKVILRPLTDADVPLLARWLFDPAVNQWLQLSEDPPTLRTVEAMRERYERMRDDWGAKIWRIDVAETGQPIGQAELVDIHPLQRRAEMHLAIGEANNRSGGYGTAAVHRLLAHAFNDLGLRRVYAMTDEDNGRAIRCFEKCGFVCEGTLRQHRLRHGRPINMVMLGALAEEWLALKE